MAKLRFKYGTMNSSKSANLLMTQHNYTEQGKKVLIFKPKLDTRDGHFVKSRALNERQPAIMIEVNELDTMFSTTQIEQPDCVLVDEVQFMTPRQIEELGEIVDILNIPVIAYGLMSDFQSKLFPGSQRLIEIGALLEEIKTICFYCNKRATMNMRLLDGEPTFDGDQVQVGGNDSYKPVCRSCFNTAKKVLSYKHQPNLVLQKEQNSKD